MSSRLGKFVDSVWGSVKTRFSRKSKRDEISRSRRRDESGPSRSSHWNKSGSSKRPSLDDDDDDDDESESAPDPLMWSKDLENHYYGEFSFAVVQGNSEIEDYSQVETGTNATFVGVYDGHGGSTTAHYIRDNLFLNLMRFVQENRTMSEANLNSAFAATEEGFFSVVDAAYGQEPLTASVGSCCLVGVIWDERLYVANLGDSRAVKGYLSKSNKIAAEQLTSDHNASSKEVRREMKAMHPGDKNIVFKKDGMWRVKGIIQVSRAIGDAYLKKPEYALDARFSRFHVPERIRRPVLRADPSMYSRDLKPADRFFIFASDGLWDHVSNQRAVEIVHKYPRAGIARRLLKSALSEAARKNNMTYDELKNQRKGVRRRIHDDTTVVVIFIDNELLEQKADVPLMSVLGGFDNPGQSMFNILKETIPNA
ncbi:Protein-serine/threonine phosphatase [Heracleum sosnowskyi]|uniref:protein-serine/threonine phosphatase n=1 Tax=Heracleum sosnowskyi TaxID=360622 RepID=A0AAD8MCN9_9APIA|nr:Protein-serine/threonine phosphatase [Heracleum sosnowskyi]